MSEVLKPDNKIIDDVLQFLNRGNKNTSFKFSNLYSIIPKERRGIIEAKLYKYDLIEEARSTTSAERCIKITDNAKIMLDDFGSYSNYLNEKLKKEKPEDKNIAEQGDVYFFELDRIHCNNCNHKTDHEIISEKIVTETESEKMGNGIDIDLWTKYIARILKCNACGEYTMKTSYVWCDDFPDFPEKGIKFTPNRGAASIKPAKTFSENVPENIRSMYAETVLAYTNELPKLCAGGIRAIIEGICISNGIEGGSNSKSNFAKNLEGKINGLAENGIITTKHANILHESRFLGNEALHELAEPSQEELKIAIEIIAHTLSTIYELGSKGAELKDKADARRTKKTK